MKKCLTCKKTRLAIGTVILCAAFIITAYKGSLDWMGIVAFGAMFGLPEAIQIARALVGYGNNIDSSMSDSNGRVDNPD